MSDTGYLINKLNKIKNNFKMFNFSLFSLHFCLKKNLKKCDFKIKTFSETLKIRGEGEGDFNEENKKKKENIFLLLVYFIGTYFLGKKKIFFLSFSGVAARYGAVPKRVAQHPSFFLQNNNRPKIRKLGFGSSKKIIKIINFSLFIIFLCFRLIKYILSHFR
jgi:hypothetical protein